MKFSCQKLFIFMFLSSVVHAPPKPESIGKGFVPQFSSQESHFGSNITNKTSQNISSNSAFMLKQGKLDNLLSNLSDNQEKFYKKLEKFFKKFKQSHPEQEEFSSWWNEKILEAQIEKWNIQEKMLEHYAKYQEKLKTMSTTLVQYYKENETEIPKQLTNLDKDIQEIVFRPEAIQQISSYLNQPLGQGFSQHSINEDSDHSSDSQDQKDPNNTVQVICQAMQELQISAKKITSSHLSKDPEESPAFRSQRSNQGFSNVILQDQKKPHTASQDLNHADNLFSFKNRISNQKVQQEKSLWKRCLKYLRCCWPHPAKSAVPGQKKNELLQGRPDQQEVKLLFDANDRQKNNKLPKAKYQKFQTPKKKKIRKRKNEIINTEKQ